MVCIPRAARVKRAGAVLVVDQDVVMRAVLISPDPRAVRVFLDLCPLPRRQLAKRLPRQLVGAPATPRGAGAQNQES